MAHSKSESALALPHLSVVEASCSDKDRPQAVPKSADAAVDRPVRSPPLCLKEETSRAASCSSLSRIVDPVDQISRRVSVPTRGTNPLRGDSTLKIFLPSDNLALKAILSPKTTEQRTSTSSTLIDKFFFRTNLSVPTPAVPTPLDDFLDKNPILVTNPHLPPPPFANMYTCESCRDDIGSLLTKGRHHCRNCGGSFCATCSAHVLPIPYQAYVTRGDLRVCDGCFHRIQNFHHQVQSTSVTWSGLDPPSIPTLVRVFALPDHEVPVSIFHCALFFDTTPYYGHLILTRKRLCFQGYVETRKIQVAYAHILSLVKPQFYYINGIQVKTREKETFFLAEFHGLRDTCFLRLDQLIRACQEARKLEHTESGASLSRKELRQQALDRRRSSKFLSEHIGSSSATSGSVLPSSLPPSEAISTVGFIDVENDHSVGLTDLMTDPRPLDDDTSTASDEEPFEPLPVDPLLGKMTLLLDCDLRADVKRVFDVLWNDGVGHDFLHANLAKARDMDIAIEAWQRLDTQDVSKMKAIGHGFVISQEDDYTRYRTVRSQHPPKTSFPGLPPYAGCTRTQRFRLAKTSHGGDTWDRFVITELNRMSQIPFSDYFEVEMRYVFSRDGNNYCHVQVGLVVNFLKATWFKSQINSSTRSESKEAIEAWAKQAMEWLELHRDRVIEAPVSCPLDTGSSTEQSSDLEEREAESGKQDVDRATEKLILETKESFPDVGLKAVDARGVDGILSRRGLVQYLLVGLLVYGFVLLRGYQLHLYQVSETTMKVLEQVQAQQAAMRTQLEMMQQRWERLSHEFETVE